MKKNIRVLFVLILVLVFVPTACTPPKKTAETTAVPTGATSAEATEERETVGNMYKEGLPLVKEKESFTLMVDSQFPDSDTINELPFCKMIEEQTNVRVEWISYNYEVAKEKLNVMLSTGEYPDAIAGWIVPDPSRYGQKEKILIPIEDLIEEYAPNVTEALNVYDWVRRDLTLPDGHIYCPPYLVEEPALSFGPWINKKWLDNLSLKSPTTYDEFYEVLKAFKDEDANGNGDPDDEIPASFRTDQFMFWSGLWGAPSNSESSNSSSDGFYYIDGKLHYAFVEKNYKEALKFTRRLYQEGLLDPELFTQDSGTWAAKNSDLDDYIYGAVISYLPFSFSTVTNPDGSYPNADQYIPLGPLSGGDCSSLLWAKNANDLTLFPHQFAITDKAKNPALIIRWLDTLYERENSIQASWGMYGITLKKNSDGTFENLPKTDVTGAPGYAESIGSMPKFLRPSDIRLAPATLGSKQIRQQWDAINAVYKDRITDKMPSAYLSEEQQKEIASIATDVSAYAKQQRAAWISGEGNIDADWDSYVAKLKELGFEQMMTVKQEAIDALSAN